MSTRTIFEINHDLANRIDEDPDGFLHALRMYLNSASNDRTEALTRYGFKRAWWGHHSAHRRIVTEYDDVKL